MAGTLGAVAVPGAGNGGRWRPGRRMRSVPLHETFSRSGAARRCAASARRRQRPDAIAPTFAAQGSRLRLSVEAAQRAARPNVHLFAPAERFRPAARNAVPRHGVARVGRRCRAA